MPSPPCDKSNVKRKNGAQKPVTFDVFMFDA
jgi:hypothetical protein